MRNETTISDESQISKNEESVALGIKEKLISYDFYSFVNVGREKKLSVHN